MRDFANPAHIPFLRLERSCDEGIDDLSGECGADDAGGHGDDVDVVMLDGLVGRVDIVRLRTADTRQFVRRDRRSSSGAAEYDPTLGAAGQHRTTHCGGEVRIIDGFGGIRSEVDNEMTLGGEATRHLLLHLESGMICADGDLHWPSSLGGPQSKARMRAQRHLGHRIAIMSVIRVVGGYPLSGEVDIQGAKNAVLKHMVAALLAPGVHRFENVPAILDVDLMGQVLAHVGAHCEHDGASLTISVPEVPLPEAPLELVRKMRASILVLGALLARCGEAHVALPGGDDFGSRPIDMHLEGLEAMGATFELSHGVLQARAPDGLHGTEIHLEFPSVGTTENILLAAAMAEGTTVIGNAAREPELADLALYLNKMGAKIEGAGTSTITVRGESRLSPAVHDVVPDRIEAGTYAIAAAISGGEVTVRRCVPDHLRMELRKLQATGCVVEAGEDWVTITGPPRPEAADFATLPYPGFHTDMHPPMVALLSVSEGTSVMTENVYAARFRYIGELNRMGADIHADGQHVVIRGVEDLSGCEVDGTDIRAGAALVLAGLRADGETTVTNAEHIDRGYDGLVPKLAALGARVDRE